MHLGPALLCPTSCPKDVRDIWRAIGRRAISSLSTLHGHIVSAEIQGEYVFCTNCLACRKASDAKHFAARPCSGDLWGVSPPEEGYLGSSGHTQALVPMEEKG